MEGGKLSFRNPLHQEKESKLLIQQRLKKRKEREEARKETQRVQQEQDRLRILDEKQHESGSPDARERPQWMLGLGNLSATEESTQKKSRPMQTRKDYNDAMRRLSISKKSNSKTDKSMPAKEAVKNTRSRHTDVYHSSEFVVSDLVKPSKSGRKALHNIPSTVLTKDAALCRICQSDEDTLSNQLVTPCRCTGSLQYVHHLCLQQWRKTKKASGSDITKCELCLQNYDSQLLGNTDVQPDHTKKMQEDLRQLVRSGVYLMLLVDFCRDSFENLLQERTERRRDAASVPVEIHPPTSQNQDARPMQAAPNNLVRNREDDESSEDNDEYVSRSAVKRRSERLLSKK